MIGTALSNRKWAEPNRLQPLPNDFRSFDFVLIQTSFHKALKPSDFPDLRPRSEFDALKPIHGISRYFQHGLKGF